MTDQPLHSPLGGSGAYRWIPCPGSVALCYGADTSEFESDEFSLPGQQAHKLAEICLNRGHDAWQYLREDTVVGKEMADAVQVYLNIIRTRYTGRNQGNSWVELQFTCSDLHEHYRGTADFVYHDEIARALHIWDYKHGAGIMVEVAENPQLMYYGAGVLTYLDLWPKVEDVILHVSQPRGHHFDGPNRSWSIRTLDLEKWLDDTLLPAMDKALEPDAALASGEHCRFCPARGLACPQIAKDFDELETLMATLDSKGSAAKLSNKDTGRFLALFEVAKIAGKAIGKSAYARLEAGKKIPGWKLVKGRSNRTWKDDAEEAIKAEFGDAAYTEPALKSPAQIEALPKGEAMTARHAFKPDAGLKLAQDKDSRSEVSKDTKSLFKPVKENQDND